MKRLLIYFSWLFLIILVDYFTAQDSLQLYCLSDRIGNEINAAEKNYYGFFPKIRDFTSAKLYHSDDDIMIKISYHLEGVSHDSIINWNKEIVKSVKNYVENLGSIPVEKMKINWSPIYPYVRPQHRSFQFGEKITINTISDVEYNGYLMTTDSTNLSLWMSDVHIIGGC